MAPWDEVTYFLTPSGSTVPMTGAVLQVLSFNPQRVGLIFSSNAPANTLTIGPSSTISATQGIALPPQSPTIALTQKDYGVLVQSAWFAFGNAALNLTIIEILMQKWPRPTDKVYTDYESPLLR